MAELSFTPVLWGSMFIGFIVGILNIYNARILKKGRKVLQVTKLSKAFDYIGLGVIVTTIALVAVLILPYYFNEMILKAVHDIAFTIGFILIFVGSDLIRKAIS